MTVPVARRSDRCAAGGLGRDVGGRALELAIHLARRGAQPDQLVEPRLVVIEEDFVSSTTGGSVGRIASCASWAFLASGLGTGAGGGHVAVAVIAADQAAGGGNRLRRNVHAVGSHISNEADGVAFDVHALIERARERMVWAGAKPSLRLASCCRVEVVNGGGGLRRAGLASIAATANSAFSSAFLKASGLGPGAHVEPLDLLLPSAPTSRASNWSPRGSECRHQRPILARRTSSIPARDRTPAAAPPIARGRPNARPAACATAPARGKADEVIGARGGRDRHRPEPRRCGGVLHRVEHGLLGGWH